MGSMTAEGLILRWSEVCRDHTLLDLPYKIELNAWGKIEMSPANNRHARLKFRVGAELASHLPAGDVLTEAAVLTDLGVRVPDVVWCSADFLHRNREQTPFREAPEICVEIVSPANTEAELQAKTQAFLAAGAKEVWWVDEECLVRYCDAAGEQLKSELCPPLVLPPPL
jgi:Uma2 family endonuclease